jgi:Na+-driven multidrug efflux pump
MSDDMEVLAIWLLSMVVFGLWRITQRCLTGSAGSPTTGDRLQEWGIGLLFSVVFVFPLPYFVGIVPDVAYAYYVVIAVSAGLLLVYVGERLRRRGATSKHNTDIGV